MRVDNRCWARIRPEEYLRCPTQEISVYKLLFKMVSVLVDRSESVVIKTQVKEDGVAFEPKSSIQIKASLHG
jgi:hypothetical protein